MTGRDTIMAALSAGGSPHIPVVIPYEGIYVRDHWRELTDCPWSHNSSPDIEQQMQWRREVIAATGQDWFDLPWFYSRERRRQVVNDEEPPPGGWFAGSAPDRLADTPDEIDRLVGPPRRRDPDDGSGDLARRMLAEFGDSLYPLRHATSPLWACYGLWGFEGMMTMAAERPELVRRACERYLAHAVEFIRAAAAHGALGIWIEECMTDMVSPQAYRSLCLPYVRDLVDEIRAAHIASIHYYCGDPSDRWDLLLSTGADAISLEESKKGFRIEIAEVVDRVGGRCAVLGNLDAIGVLRNGSEEELRSEIARQIAAGRRNAGRFVMSLGSPVTPATPVSRVRLYCDLAHDLARPTHNS